MHWIGFGRRFKLAAGAGYIQIECQRLNRLALKCLRIHLIIWPVSESHHRRLSARHNQARALNRSSRAEQTQTDYAIKQRVQAAAEWRQMAAFAPLPPDWWANSGGRSALYRWLLADLLADFCRGGRAHVAPLACSVASQLAGWRANCASPTSSLVRPVCSRFWWQSSRPADRKLGIMLQAASRAACLRCRAAIQLAPSSDWLLVARSAELTSARQI